MGIVYARAVRVRKNGREVNIMKKSDIAIYISAVLTLVLTTFVVFSTQQVSYENKVDDLIRNSSVSENHLAMATDTDTTSDVRSPLFSNRLPDESSDIRRAEAKDLSEPALRSIEDKPIAKVPDTKGGALNEKSFADMDLSALDSPARKEAIFDDEAQDRIIGKPLAPSAAKPEQRPPVSGNGDFKSPEPIKKVEPAKKLEPPKTEPVRKLEPPIAKDTQNEPAKINENTAQRAVSASAPQPSVTNTSGRFHTVAYGDMLRTIAARYGTTTLKLIQINNFANPDLIYPGQKVRLP